MDMKAAIRAVLVQLARTPLAQRLLERNVAASQYLMGIGSGGGIRTSGEIVLVDRLSRHCAETKAPLCVFDIGANTGAFLHLLADSLGDVPMTCHAFEPGGFTFARLQENVAAGAGVVLNNIALGRSAGIATLYSDVPGSGLASLGRRRLDHLGIEFDQVEEVEVSTVDAYCAERGVERIDLIKLDVEGYELDVLAGAARMFKERRVRMVSFEFGGCNIDSRTYFQDFWYLFQEYGMQRLYRITPSGHLAEIRRYDEALEQFRTTNFLAVLAGESTIEHASR
jgi:FkbM family methyltransferase